MSRRGLGGTGASQKRGLVNSVPNPNHHPGVRVAILHNDLSINSRGFLHVNQTLRFPRRDWLITDRINQVGLQH